MPSFKSLNSKILKFIHGSLTAWLILSPLLAIAPLAPKTAYAAVIAKPSNLLTLNSGLVGWWTFDGKDMAPNVRDKSGNGNHGNLSGQISTTTIVGKLGQALQFDGADDHTRIEHDAILDFGGSDSFTVSTWVTSSKTNYTEPGIILSKRGTGNPRYELAFDTAENIAWTISDGSTALAISSDSSLADQRWHHVVAMVDRSGNAMRMWVDGVLQADTETPGTNSPSNAQPLGIGAELTTPIRRYFEGRLDDVRIYNRALSASEVSALYNSGAAKFSSSPTSRNPSLEQGLVGHWTFDGKYMTPNVRDTSGQVNHGNLSHSGSGTTTAVGKLGQALQFDGTNDIVDVSINAGMPVYSTLQPYTLSFWVKPKTNSGEECFYSETEAGNRRLLITAFNGGSGVRVWHPTDASPTNTNGSSALSLNAWNHIVWVDNAGSAQLYINGVQDATNFNYTPGTNTTPDRVKIGACWAGFNYAFAKSALDDVRAYNRALSANEVKALYNEGANKMAATPATGVAASGCTSGINCGLAGHWTLDGKNLIQNVTDSGPNGNHGVLTGFTSTSSAQAIGRFGQALRFDGSNDRVTVADTNNTLDAASVVSISAWVYPNDLAGGEDWTAVVGKGGNYYLGYQNDDFAITFNSGGWRNHFASNYTNDQWYHLVGVIDNPNDRVYIYVNGELVTNEAETNDMVVNDTAFSIGDNVGQNEYTRGAIDDVRVYTRVISANEVKQLYNMGR